MVRVSRWQGVRCQSGWQGGREVPDDARGVKEETRKTDVQEKSKKTMRNILHIFVINHNLSQFVIINHIFYYKLQKILFKTDVKPI